MKRAVREPDGAGDKTGNWGGYTEYSDNVREGPRKIKFPVSCY
jgi:hypothetical protein